MHTAYNNPLIYSHNLSNLRSKPLSYPRMVLYYHTIRKSCKKKCPMRGSHGNIYDIQHHTIHITSSTGNVHCQYSFRSCVTRFFEGGSISIYSNFRRLSSAQYTMHHSSNWDTAFKLPPCRLHMSWGQDRPVRRSSRSMSCVRCVQ